MTKQFPTVLGSDMLGAEHRDQVTAAFPYDSMLPILNFFLIEAHLSASIDDRMDYSV
jgi:hypothetical protein